MTTTDPTAATPSPTPTTLAQAEIQLYAALQHAGARGPSTSEFWVGILKVPTTALASFLVSFLLAHGLLHSDLATAVTTVVVTGLSTAASAYVAAAYVKGRSLVKAALIDLRHLLGMPAATATGPATGTPPPPA